MNASRLSVCQQVLDCLVGLVSKYLKMGRKRKNHVYAYFTYQKETNTSTCDIEDCNKVIKGNHGTNLLHHISSKHFEEYNIVMRYNNLANDVQYKENCDEGASSAVIKCEGSRNIPTEETHTTEQEFIIPERSYDRSEQREEELHQLKVAEKEWTMKAAEQNYYKAKAEKDWTVKAAEENYYKAKVEKEWTVKAAEEKYYKAKVEKEWSVKAAEQNYYKAKAEREAAEEVRLFNRAKRMEAEMSLNKN